MDSHPAVEPTTLEPKQQRRRSRFPFSDSVNPRSDEVWHRAALPFGTGKLPFPRRLVEDVLRTGSRIVSRHSTKCGQRTRPSIFDVADWAGLEPARPCGRLPWTPNRQSSVCWTATKIGQRLLPTSRPALPSRAGNENGTHMDSKPANGFVLRPSNEAMIQTFYLCKMESESAVGWSETPVGIEPTSIGLQPIAWPSGSSVVTVSPTPWTTPSVFHLLLESFRVALVILKPNLHNPFAVSCSHDKTFWLSTRVFIECHECRRNL